MVKGWCTERALGIASNGMQVHGGIGFVEETGVAQHLRDARITTIYEGTTAIQANDLIGRKLARDGGAVMRRLIAMMAADARTIGSQGDALLTAVARSLSTGLAALEQATISLLASAPREAAAGAVAYLGLCGTVMGGWLMTKAAEATTIQGSTAAGRAMVVASVTAAVAMLISTAPSASPPCTAHCTTR